MSQQEFFQGSQFQEQKQGQPSLGDDDIEYPAQPYYWSTQPGKGAPKDEPASLSDEPMGSSLGGSYQDDHQSDYQHGYAAQDSISSSVGGRFTAPRQRSNGGPSQSQRQRFSPDGDSFEHQYHPYTANNQQWSVPPWARPQQHKRSAAGWVWLVILGLVFIGPLLHILGALLAVVGMIVLVLVLPFLLVAIMALPYMLFRSITGRPSPGRRWRYPNYWRGPWRW
jgi:hypothetical protein